MLRSVRFMYFMFVHKIYIPNEGDVLKKYKINVSMCLFITQSYPYYVYKIISMFYIYQTFHGDCLIFYITLFESFCPSLQTTQIHFNFKQMTCCFWVAEQCLKAYLLVRPCKFYMKCNIINTYLESLK